jgi:hypothetical protein
MYYALQDTVQIRTYSDNLLLTAYISGVETLGKKGIFAGNDPFLNKDIIPLCGVSRVLICFTRALHVSCVYTPFTYCLIYLIHAVTIE